MGRAYALIFSTYIGRLGLIQAQPGSFSYDLLKPVFKKLF
jgi:hypothetical protein